jgi:hypothetical protein
VNRGAHAAPTRHHAFTILRHTFAADALCSGMPKAPPSFAALVQAWFAEYLTQQRALSAQTIAACRDSFVLFQRTKPLTATHQRLPL